ncbi:MAG: hypothetical protein ACRC9P_06815, partial [Bacteroides sp.]
TDRNSLKHDDRLESLAGMVRMFKYDLLVDADKASEKRREAFAKEFYDNPMGYSPEQMKQMDRQPRQRIRQRRSGLISSRGRRM